MLQTSQVWSGWVYRLLVAVVIASILYTTFGTLHEYAVGPALTKVEGRSVVTSTTAGIVAAIHVVPGQRVAANDHLVSLYDEQEAAEYRRLDHLYETQLVKTLRDPSDRAAGQELNVISTQRSLAKVKLEERSIRASHDGVVSDIRIRLGQHLQAGDTLFALNGDNATWSIIAMLPGQYRPMLHPGTSLRFEMHGYRFAYRELIIDSVGDEVVGPSEVKRFLGPEFADTVPVNGPVVLVHAYLPSNHFTVGDRSYQYYEGLPGSAEARVRTESILLSLVPWLRQFFRGEQ